MSGLGKRGPGGGVVGALQGVLGSERCFCADMLQVPEAGWPISADAPQTVDTQSTIGVCRAFDSDQERGVGFSLTVPQSVTKIQLRCPGRVLDDAPDERAIVLRLYARANGGAWSGASALGILHLPNNLTQSASFSSLLSSLGLAAGDSVQFLLSRNPGSASDTLDGRWGLYEIGVNFA